MGDAEDGIYEQFIEFFVGVTLGREGIKKATKENLDDSQTVLSSIWNDPPSEQVPDVLNIIRSESITRRSKVKNKETINEHTSSISQTVNSSQKIKIKCGTRPFYDHEYEFKDVKYDLFGNEIEGSGCPRWGCCYDVAQTGDVQLMAINNTLLDQTDKMYNNTIQEITHELNVTLDGKLPEDDTAWYNSKEFAVGTGVACVATGGLGCAVGGAIHLTGNLLEDEKRTQIIEQVARSINESKDIANERIKNTVDKAISQTINTSDTIDVEYISPQLCVNTCGESPTSGTVSQSLQIDALAENITKIVIEEIEKNIVNQSSEVSTSASTVNMPMIYTFAFGTMVSLVCIYVVSYIFVIAVYVAVLKEPPPPLAAKVMAVICFVQCWCYLPVGMWCCFHRYSWPWAFMCVFPGTGHLTSEEDDEGEAKKVDDDMEKTE